jgi:DNA-binding response OmpR family regulator
LSSAGARERSFETGQSRTIPETQLPQADCADPGWKGNPRDESAALKYANIELRPNEQQVFIGGQRVAFTLREFEVLQALVERSGRVVRRHNLYERVWGGEMRHRERSVDVFVRKVRIKLADAAPDWVYIHTHFGIGYRFTPEPRLDGS